MGVYFGGVYDMYLSAAHVMLETREARYNARFIQKDTHFVLIACGVLDTTRTTFHELLVAFSLREANFA